MKLPTYDEARIAKKSNCETPITFFVERYSPSSYILQERFRERLQALIDYVQQETCEQCKKDQTETFIRSQLIEQIK